MVLALAVVVSLSCPARGQDEADPPNKAEPIALDLSFDYDPEALREHLPPRLHFKKIWGPFGLAGYHLPPAAESGPYDAPPKRIWDNGFGTSLWRDPVTGWPLQ